MPTNYSPSAKTIAATVSVLQDGDPVNMDDLYKEAAPGGTPKLTLAYLADCVKGLTQQLVGERTATAPFENNLGSSVTTLQGSASANSLSTQVLDLPHGTTLTKVTFSVDPSNTTPPAGTKVQMQIWKRNVAAGADTPDVQIGGTVTDPTTGTAYGSPHTFDLTCSEVIDRTAYFYYATLVGEAGTGAGNCLWFGTIFTTA